MRTFSPLYASLATIVAALLGGIAFYFVGMFIGAVTGVIAMCATAPMWCVMICLGGFVIGLLASMLYSGQLAYGRYRKGCDAQSI